MVLLLLLAAVLAIVYRTRKLTGWGTLAAGLLAIAIFQGAGRTGIALLGSFFILGTAVTLLGKKKKVNAGLSTGESARRDAGQVLANGGVAGFIGLFAWFFPAYAERALLLMAGAFSAAAADTLASELGVLYGRRFYNIRNFKPDIRGLDGVVSLEGTVLGLLGSLVMALVLGLVEGIWQLPAVLVAGTIGNLVDSWLGASLERKGRLSNDMVNTANTLAGALVMALLSVW